MENQAACPIKASVAVIGGKWKTGILYRLARRTYRFGELNREMSWISEKVLIRQLRELQDAGVVARRDFGEVPPKVEYSLTEYGKSLAPLLDHIAAWGKNHLARRVLSADNQPNSSRSADANEVA
jgi:DNA-binding HxlR family transcriptional regulator